ncbi:GNAT family N-acetyltransferase [Pontibacter sp. KCTC 32443]|uniref:GNAT family N-acetyltransferase n=1 Tax=Pontibacter TaxID=323449 RepID=UPI00164CFC59|nr:MULTISPECIES: GNAT family protein [Pontibacter]MBC5774443.1 GNAT family N-acetyltransferase [Pontibacter sp. KCTC 32443]
MSQNLETARLQLRPVRPSDADFILKGLSDTRVTTYYAVHYDTPEAVQEQMQFYDNLQQTGTGIWWVFSLRGATDLIGACGYSSLETENRKAEIGFWLLPEHWGKGYIPEAAKAILKYGFESMNLHRIEAIVEGGNAQSEKVLQKLGFTREGRLRDREIKNGHFIDLVHYSLLETDEV